MKKKVITAILLSCVSISCLFGCGEQNTQADNTTDKDKGKYHFEIIVQSYQSSYWQAAALGIQEAAADLNVDVEISLLGFLDLRLHGQHYLSKRE